MFLSTQQKICIFVCACAKLLQWEATDFCIPIYTNTHTHTHTHTHIHNSASQVVLVVKNLPARAGDMDLIPGSGRYPGGGHGNPLQCSCLENPMERGAWRATVHGVTESQTRLKLLSTHTHT